MRIIVKQLTFHYYKGIKELVVPFKQDITTITGDNGLGKSSVFGGFCFLLFGKDQFDSAAISEIKTYDKEGKHLSKVEHSVEGIFLIDGKEIILKRILREKWVKPHGETVRIMDGHEYIYFINGVRQGTERAFKEEVAKIIAEKTFKLLTNPHYFNDILSWQERRAILTEIVPPISDSDVVDKIATLHNKEAIQALTSILNSGQSMEKHKRELAAQKKSKKEELDAIPHRIDATRKTDPEVPAEGFNVVEERINALEKEIEEIETSLSDASKANEQLLKKQRDKQSTVHNLKLALQNAQQAEEDKIRQERNKQLKVIRGIEDKIAEEQRNISSIQKEIEGNNATIKTLEERKAFAEKRKPELDKEREDLLQQWYEVDGRKFIVDKTELSCPTCSRKFEGENLQSKTKELQDAFNQQKSKDLEAIENKGKVINQDRETYETNLKKFDDDIAGEVEKNLKLAHRQTEYQTSIDTLSEQVKKEKEKLSIFETHTRTETTEEQTLKQQIKDAETQQDTDSNTPDNSSNELREQKRQKQETLNSLRAIFSGKAQIEKNNKLIEGYEAQEKVLAQDLADLERQEDIIDKFNRTKIESIESGISGLFKIVKFKLFDTQLNGEIVPCCEATVDGVPFRSLNTAMKVNAGLDVINALCKHYGITAPIFIDNRESISELIPTQSQIINLEKVKGQNKLKIA